VYLSASSEEVDDIIFRASPWLEVKHESTGIDAYLRYRLDWYKYNDVDVSQSHHMGEGSLTGKMFNEALLVEIGATRSQALRNQTQIIQSGRLPLAGNVIDRDEVYAHPRIETNLGKAITLSTGYLVSEGSYDDPLVQEDTNHHATFSLDNYAGGSGLTWALRYDGRKTEYEISREWKYQQATAELGFWANKNLRIFASGGTESPWDEPFNADMEDTFWEAGIAYTGVRDLSIVLAAGERSFGTSWRGSVEYTFQRGGTSISYTESPTTTGFNRSNVRRSVLDPDDLDEFLDEPGRAERYLSKRLNWGLNLGFRRTSFGFALFDERREGRIQADGSPLGDEAQSGVQANFEWQAGTRTAFVLFGSLIRREQQVTGDSDYRRIGAGVNYSLGQRSTISLDYAFDEQKPSESNLGGYDYESNVVSLFFTFIM
jgi:uncharacterized protein (PEP-CTERM system associated)